VADLGVSHLAVRKPNSFSRGMERSMRIISQQFFINRRVRRSNSVTIGMSVYAPPIEHDQDNVFILHQITSWHLVPNS
jgi:hypothetical protein